MSNILIAGGTGFIGKTLIPYLQRNNHKISVLTRVTLPINDNISYYKWNIEKDFIDKNAFENIDTIINLTGVNIGEKRWTKHRKAEILNSRINSIDLLYKYVSENNITIKTFISSSAIGYYGNITSKNIFEENDKSGKDFLAEVCTKWEETAKMFEKQGTRVVILRQGVVLGKDGGMYKKLAPLAKLRINTAVGDGKQYLPWIDIRDLIRMYNFVLNNNEIKGIFNAVASQHITLNDFSKKLLESFKRKSYLPNVPTFIIKLFMGELSSMILNGSRISNDKIKKYNFTFDYDSINQSLNIIKTEDT